jgi:hypothetical protein
MYSNLDEKLAEMGLVRAQSIIEIFLARTFIVDTNCNFTDKKDRFPVYPIIDRKLNLTHDLLNLYGVHWRYLVNTSNLYDIIKDEGDTNAVLLQIRQQRELPHHAIYAFTQKYISQFKSLWYFMPNTIGGQYYQKTLLPLFQANMQEYKTIKSGLGL